MKIESIVSFDRYGSLDVQLDDAKMTIRLTPEEAARCIALATEIYESRQASIAAEVARPAPALAHFTEVADDISF